MVYNNSMEKIKQVIVVEGQNDINKLVSCVNCNCLKTNGTHISTKLIKQLKVLNKTRGVIIFTDDDYPGRYIRTILQNELGHVGHAYIDKKVSRTTKKVGVEHASCDEIRKSLSKVVIMETSNESFPFSDYVDMDLVLNHKKRNKLIEKLGLPIMNSKRFYKVLNMMSITPQELFL